MPKKVHKLLTNDIIKKGSNNAKATCFTVYFANIILRTFN